MFGGALNEVDEPAVRCRQLRADLGQRQAPFLFRHAGVEGVDAPYRTEYLGGVPPSRMSGRCVNASSSHVVTCARISRTDQAPVTPGRISCTSDRPAYDSLNATHALSSRFRSCRLFTNHSLCRPDQAARRNVRLMRWPPIRR